MTLKTSLLILMSIAMIVSIPNLAFATVADGELSKYSSDGKYKIDLFWQPAGSLQPNIDYMFKFQVSEGITEKIISDSSFNLDFSNDGDLIQTVSKSPSSETLTTNLTFDESGMFEAKIYNLVGTEQDVNFIFPVSTGESKTIGGISYGSKTTGDPQMFFCKGNAITLSKCFETESYEDYNWFGTMNILIYAPGWNNDSDKIDTIGGTQEDPLTVTSRSEIVNAELGICDGLVETGADTGLFVGRLKLSGHDYDMDGDGALETGLGGTGCGNSPIDEYAKIETGRDGAVTVNWQYSDDPVKILSKSLTYHWNLGELSFLQDGYNIDDTLEFTLKDKDLGDMAKDKMDLNFKVWSDSDTTGILVQTGENYGLKAPLDFTVNARKTIGTSLYALPGDTITVEYYDCTIPISETEFTGISYSKGDCVEVYATTQILSDYPSIIIQ